MTRVTAETIFAALKREESFSRYTYPGPVTGLPHIGHGILLPLHRQELAILMAMRNGWPEVRLAGVPETANPLNLWQKSPTNRIWQIRLPIEEAESEALMRMRMDRYWWATCRHKPFVPLMPESAQNAVAQMVYQMGVPKTMGFSRMWRALHDAKMQTARHEALDSKWAREQTPKRARRVAALFFDPDGYQGAGAEGAAGEVAP